MRMAKQKSGSADSAKVSQQNIALRRVLSSPYSLALFAALAGAFFAWLFDFLPSVFPKSKGDPHTYSFVMNGRTISGRSTNPFEETGNYRARVETCEQGGIEKYLRLFRATSRSDQRLRLQFQTLEIQRPGFMIMERSRRYAVSVFREGLIKLYTGSRCHLAW